MLHTHTNQGSTVLALKNLYQFKERRL